MNLLNLIKITTFEDVAKELLLTDKSLYYKLTLFQNYYLYLKNIPELPINKDYVLKIDRECFKTVNLYKNNDFKLQLDLSYNSYYTYLSASIAHDDLKELSKELIIAGVLYTITFEGTCFNEEDRQREYEIIDSIMSNNLRSPYLCPPA